MGPHHGHRSRGVRDRGVKSDWSAGNATTGGPGHDRCFTGTHAWIARTARAQDHEAVARRVESMPRGHPKSVVTRTDQGGHVRALDDDAVGVLQVLLKRRGTAAAEAGPRRTPAAGRRCRRREIVIGGNPAHRGAIESDDALSQVPICRTSITRCPSRPVGVLGPADPPRTASPAREGHVGKVVMKPAPARDRPGLKRSPPVPTPGVHFRDARPQASPRIEDSVIAVTV
jgi:hypothetical protein